MSVDPSQDARLREGPSPTSRSTALWFADGGHEPRWVSWTSEGEKERLRACFGDATPAGCEDTVDVSRTSGPGRERAEGKEDAMPYFDDVRVFYDLLVGVFDALMKDPQIRQKALDSKLLVRFVYRNPEGEAWVDCRGEEVKVYTGGFPGEATPDASMSMELDTAHRFWCGELNLLGALSSGEIEAEGSMPRLLKMLPVIKPAYDVYKNLLREKGLEHLIVGEEEEED